MTQTLGQQKDMKNKTKQKIIITLLFSFQVLLVLTLLVVCILRKGLECQGRVRQYKGP